MQQVTKTITSAQILASFTAPIALVPAPGAGIALEPIAVAVKLHFGTAAYVGANNLVASVGAPANGHSIEACSSTTLDAAVDTIEENVGATQTTPAGPAADFENQPINLSTLTANPTVGDGTLTVTVFYNSSRTS